MNLFIDAVSRKWVICIFDANRHILDTVSIDLQSKESRLLPSILDTLVKEKIGGFKKLNTIVVVHGPGSFTWVRAIVLTVNTLKFIYPHISLVPLSYFSLFSAYPIVKPSSKKDAFVQFSPEEDIRILTNEQFFEICYEKGITCVFWEEIPGSTLKFENRVNYDTIIQDVVFTSQSLVAPLYIKKPNIS
jgi:hypothetical protein